MDSSFINQYDQVNKESAKLTGVHLAKAKIENVHDDEQYSEIFNFPINESALLNQSFFKADGYEGSTD